MQLKLRLGTDILQTAAESELLLTNSPEDWQLFTTITNECPACLKKPTWGPYCIGLEFSGATLDVGVIGGGKSPVAADLMKRLGDTHGNENWACWASLYNTDLKSLYVDVATGMFLTKLRPRLAALCQALDALQQEGLLSA